MINLVLGAGVSLDLRTGGGNDRTSVSIYDYKIDEDRNILIIDSSENQLTGSIDFTLRANIMFEFALIQIEFFRNRQLLSYPKTGV